MSDSEDQARQPAIPDLLDVNETAAILRVGHTYVYESSKRFLATGDEREIPAIKVGRLLRIPRVALERFIGALITWPIPIVEQAPEAAVRHVDSLSAGVFALRWYATLAPPGRARPRPRGEIMNPTFGGAVRQAEETTVTETDVDVICGNQGPLCEALYEWTDNESLAEGVSFLLGTPVKIVIIALAALVLNRIFRRAIKQLVDGLGTATADHGDAVVTERSVERAEERASTIGSLLRSLSSAVIYSAALILMLDVFGISVIPVIASAGVLAIAIGFGAQSVVEDLLRGLFMLGEDQFGVGDRINVGPVNGYVERVTLRTTVIRDTQGTLWHVPNSEIDWVANEAQETSRATIEIGVAYTANLDDAMEVLLRAATDAADDPVWEEHVTRPPEVSGVQELTDDAVNIRVIVWVDAGERRRFERHLRQHLKEALDTAGIEMPNQQVDVWMRGQSAAA